MNSDKTLRRNVKTLKQQLPYPYNQDLSKILRGLNRRTSFSRRRLANDPVTAAYLAAAVRLIQRHLGPGASRRMADPDDHDSIERPLLGFLSQRAVAAEVDRNPPPFHRVGRVSTMRERWRHQSAFVADVLRFGLSASHYYSGVRDDEVTDAVDQIVSGQDAVRSIHHLGSLMMSRLLTSPMFRLGLIAAAEAEGDPVIREAISERHGEAWPLWRKRCEELLRSRDLRIRPGITIDDCIILLCALADGLAMRTLADPSTRALDHDGQRSLLSMGALALVAGCLQSTGRDESRSLEQAVSDLLGGPSAGTERRMA
ncbi:MAG TPA: hypothetical protein VH637_25855 [Streptosporangiaceae bacterium]|jgi:hypothetical protein